jgi:hypothetical protein
MRHVEAPLTLGLLFVQRLDRPFRVVRCFRSKTAPASKPDCCRLPNGLRLISCKHQLTATYFGGTDLSCEATMIDRDKKGWFA